VFLAGPSAPVSYVYVARGERRIMLVRPGPAIEPHLLGIESILPIQFVSDAPRTGERALLARLLVEALGDAGLLVGGRWRHHPPPPPRPQLATRWLLGELDGEVCVPFGWLCDALNIDAETVGRIVRQRAR
jgi:hypothetical protein